MKSNYTPVIEKSLDADGVQYYKGGVRTTRGILWVSGSESFGRSTTEKVVRAFIAGVKYGEAIGPVGFYSKPHRVV